MRAAVVVPTYNEAENLPRLAEALLALTPALEVVVVDDGSPDGTGSLADAIATRESRFHVIHRSGERGYSASSKDGIAFCLAHGFELVATMDADLSHDPQVLPKLIAAVAKGCDLAIGSRYVAGGRLEVDWGPVRRAVSKSGSAYARFMVGTAAHDCTSGFRCYRATSLARIAVGDIKSEGYSFLIELLAALEDAGATVVEIPITYVDRERGVSKISGNIVGEALLRTTGLGIARMTGARRRAALKAP